MLIPRGNRHATISTFIGLAVILLATAVPWLSCGYFSPVRRGNGGKTVVTWMIGSDFQRPMWEELAGRFEKANPDLRVEILWTPGVQYQTKLKTLIAAGQAPDLINCGDVWVAYFLPFLYDITPFIERDGRAMGIDDFYPELLAASRYRGRYYYLPRSYNVEMLYYNKAIFDEAKEPYPSPNWTWADYARAGERLTFNRVELTDGTVRRFKIGQRIDIPDRQIRRIDRCWGSDIMLGWWGEWLALVQQAGGRLLDDTMTRCLLDSPAAVEGMRFYFDTMYRYRIAPPPGYGPINGFAGGRIAMQFGGHTGNWLFYNSIKGLAWDIQLLPKGPKTRKGGEISVDAYGISKQSRHPEAAWRLLRCIVARDSIERQVRMGVPSVRKSVAQKLLLAPGRTANPHNIPAMYESLKYAEPVPRSPDFIELALDVIQPEIDRMVFDQVDPAVACRRATAAADAFLAVLGQKEPSP